MKNVKTNTNRKKRENLSEVKISSSQSVNFALQKNIDKAEVEKVFHISPALIVLTSIYI